MKSLARTLALVLSLAAASGCATENVGSLARASRTQDFETYRLRRVGLLPVKGTDLTNEHARSIQEAILIEVSQTRPWEIVALSDEDVAEVEGSEPYRRGSYLPATILELSRRYQLDALLVTTATHVEPLPPQGLGLELDLVASETGLVIWTAGVQLDGSDAAVRASVARFEGGRRSITEEDGPQLSLLSPSRFARFAAHELARTL